MRNRYQNEQDLPLAEKWLDSYLLTRKNPTSGRLLHTTRLTDLIYDGFEKEQPPRLFPAGTDTPNLKTLAKDLFAALYSPVLRRRDADSIKQKERILNQPLFERTVRNDHFDDLKCLCEDKELPSYHAAFAFCETLVRDFPAADIPELRYLKVIEQLTVQAKRAIQAICDIRSRQMPVSAKKLLFLYNRAPETVADQTPHSKNPKSCCPLGRILDAGH